MPTMTYSLSNFSRTNTDMAAGTTFTCSASGSAVSNSYITSATLYLSSIRTYSGACYLDFSLGSGSASTSTFSNNSTSHGETVSVNNAGAGLLTAGGGTMNFTVRRNTSGSGNLLNIRSGLTGTLTLNYAYNYSACGAPSAVSVNANNVAPGANVTLSWSGASSGTSNAITGYQIYRATSAGGSYSHIATVSTSSGSGSTTVAAPTSSGSSYYYKVLTVGSVSGYNSGQSSAYATLTCSFSAPSAPSTVTLGGATAFYALAGASVTLAWSGAGAGTNNPITGYQVYRNGASLQSTTSTSLAVQAHSTAGSSYYYQVYTLGSHSNSAASASRYLYTYSHPSAPTAVSASNTNPNAGTAVTLSWSGAAAGSYNAITGYEIHRSTTSGGTYSLLTSVSTTAASGSVSVTAHATMGSAYYYKVITVGERSKSGVSSAYATVTSKVYTACTAPTAVSVSANNVAPGASVTLSWSGAAAGTNNAIAQYQVYRATAAAGSYSLLTTVTGTATSGSTGVTAQTTRGSSYYYKVLTVGAVSGYNSGQSTAYATLTTMPNTAPNAPAINAPTASKTTYNPNPRVLITIGSDPEGQQQTLTASGYTVSTTGNLAVGKKILLMRTAAFTAPGSGSVSVTTQDTEGAASGAASVSYTYATLPITDATLAVNTTFIKAVHMTELRTAVNTIRAYYGLAAKAWGESITAGVTMLANWTAHVLELRTAINEVVTHVNGWDTASSQNRITAPAWIDIPTNKPTAAVMYQLREVIKTL